MQNDVEANRRLDPRPVPRNPRSVSARAVANVWLRVTDNATAVAFAAFISTTATVSILATHFGWPPWVCTASSLAGVVLAVAATAVQIARAPPRVQAASAFG